MKKNFTFALFMLGFQLATAQTNIFPENGHVGIGTTTPWAALHIVKGGTNAGLDYASLNIKTTNAQNYFGPIVYLDGTSGTGGRQWGMVSSGSNDVAVTGAIGNFAIYDANAQASRLIINAEGTVSIGTKTPSSGILTAQGLITSQTAGILSAGNNDAFNLFAGGAGYLDGARQNILWSQAGLTVGRFGSEYVQSREQVDFVWRDLYNNGGSTAELMRLTAGGFLGIGGVKNPDERLTVNGKIHAKEVRIDMKGWPDYVFDPEYKLLQLNEVEAYIHKNHHLPELPSAAEVSANGLRIGEINKLLTQKIEELTLYLIEKDKQISDQKRISDQQELRIKALEEAIKRK